MASRVGLVRLHILEQAGMQLIDVQCNFKELLGMVVGYHQPYYYPQSDVFKKLVEFGTPPIKSHSYIERVVGELSNIIIRNTYMRPHYMTHDFYLSDGLLVVVERLSKETGVEHMPSFTLEDEIKWAITYD